MFSIWGSGGGDSWKERDWKEGKEGGVGFLEPYQPEQKGAHNSAPAVAEKQFQEIYPFSFLLPLLFPKCRQDIVNNNLKGRKVPRRRVWEAQIKAGSVGSRA